MPVIGFGVPIHESVEGYAYVATSMLWAAWRDVAPADWRLKVAVSRGCDVSENRNRIAKELLGEGAEVSGVKYAAADAERSPLTTHAADVIVWNDSDCLVQPEEYVRLVDTLLAQPEDVAAVGYAFPMQTDARPRPNFAPADGGNVEFDAGRPGGPPAPVRLVECAWIGFGVVATRASAYRAMGAGPWFTFASGEKGRGEDIGWCRSARDLGFRIMVDVGVMGTHCYRAPHRLDDFYAQHHKEA